MCIGYDPFPEALPFLISTCVFGLTALALFIFEYLKKTKKNSIKWAIITMVLLTIISALIFYYRMKVVANFLRC